MLCYHNVKQMGTMSMKLYVSCFTNDFEIMQTKWAYKRIGRRLPAKLQSRYDNQSGNILVYDWASDTQITSIDQRCPFGLCVKGSRLLVLDAKDNLVRCYS